MEETGEGIPWNEANVQDYYSIILRKLTYEAQERLREEDRTIIALCYAHDQQLRTLFFEFLGTFIEL